MFSFKLIIDKEISIKHHSTSSLIEIAIDGEEESILILEYDEFVKLHKLMNKIFENYNDRV